MNIDETKFNLESLRKQKQVLETIIRLKSLPLQENQLKDIINLIIDIENEIISQSIVHSDGLKEVHVCEQCASDNVEYKVWYNPNQRIVDKTYCTPSNDEAFCNDCNTYARLVLIKMNVAAKVIGYQVYSKQDARVKHPDMDNEFCLYNLTQAKKMLKSGSEWQLLTIWTGDILGSIQMFEGSPRD